MNEKRIPESIYAHHNEKGIRHFIRDSKVCPDNENKFLSQKMADENTASGSARNTRSQSQKTEHKGIKTEKTVG